MKILLLEDDAMLGDIILENLQLMGHDVLLVEDGFHAEEEAVEGKYDLWLFDINVPGLNGFELLEGLRKSGAKTAAIFITSLDDIDSLKKGFKVGADDYIRKPFEMAELEARIDNLNRRLALDVEMFELESDLFFYPKMRKIIKNKTHYELPQKASDILYFFMTHPNMTHAHEDLIDEVWANEEHPTDSALRAHIKKLRKTLGAEYIKTIHGQGYRFEI